jgi:YcxB-like protein
MDASIRISYTPTQHDYSAVLRAFFWLRTGTKVSLGVLAAAFLVVLYLVLSKGSPPSLFEVVWLLLPPLLIGYLLLVQPARLARLAANNEQLITQATWEIGTAGVNISSRFGATLLEWESLEKLVTTRDYFLLLSRTNKNAFRFLPRRAFTSEEQEAQFIHLIE